MRAGAIGSRPPSAGAALCARGPVAGVEGTTAPAEGGISRIAASGVSWDFTAGETRVLVRTGSLGHPVAKRPRSAHVRVATILDSSRARDGAPSRLKKLAVTEATLKDYSRQVALFEKFGAQESLPLGSDSEIEIVLLELMDGIIGGVSPRF